MFLRIDTTADEPLQLNENFVLHVLGEGRGQVVQGKAIKLVGRRLIATVADPLAAGVCVSIPCREGRLLAEAVGSWRESRTNFVSLDVVQSLHLNPARTRKNPR